jgi:hypothetical protein
MYMYAPPGLADTPGQQARPALGPELRDWLKRVRTHPESFQMQLATAVFHPRPLDGRFLANHNILADVPGAVPRVLFDAILLDGVMDVDILDRLRRISRDFEKRNRAWRRTIEDAVKVRGEYMNAMSVMGRRPEALGTFPLATLLPAASLETDSSKLARLGHAFAKEKLSAGLFNRMLKTPAFDAHFYLAGRWLQRYAEVLQTKDAAFKRLVDEKLALVKQIQKEKEQQQKRKP